jgi:L-aminopeptidase/D-esterase-like protein
VLGAHLPGLRVGHASLRGSGALTGSTVVLAPSGGAVAGVDALLAATPVTTEAGTWPAYRTLFPSASR